MISYPTHLTRPPGFSWFSPAWEDYKVRGLQVKSNPLHQCVACQTLVVVYSGNDVKYTAAADLLARINYFSDWFEGQGARVIVLNVIPRNYDFTK